MLTIYNIHKLIGEGFIDDRFLFSNFEETPTHLRFWFNDIDDIVSAGGVWVEIEREGRYDDDYGYKMYWVTYSI